MCHTSNICHIYDKGVNISFSKSNSEGSNALPPPVTQIGQPWPAGRLAITGWGCSQAGQHKRHCILFNLTLGKYKREKCDAGWRRKQNSIYLLIQVFESLILLESDAPSSQTLLSHPIKESLCCLFCAFLFLSPAFFSVVTMLPFGKKLIKNTQNKTLSLCCFMSL